MRSPHLRGWPASLFVATLVVELAAVGLSWRLEPRWDTVVYALYAVTLAAAGALILSRYPGHRIGLLFLAAAVVEAVGDLAQGWGLRAAEQHWPVGPFAEWFALWGWVLSGPLMVLTFLLFPDGHLTRRGWALVAWVNVVGVALLVPGWALSPDLGDLLVGHRNPYAVDAPWRSALQGLGMVVFLVSVVVSIVPLLLRLRDATGVERLQLRWFVFACACAAVVLPVVALLWTAAPFLRPLTALALTAMPVGAAVGILRYRLYDIDVVISRTLAYGALSLLLAGTYALTVVVIGAAVGHGSPWTTAGATLAVAVAFGPLRRRVQDGVDRRFDRARFDALQRMATFLDDLRAGRAAPEAVEGVLREALGVADLHLHLLLPDSGLVVDLDGLPVDDDPGPGQRSWPIRHAGTTLGAVVAPAALTERGTLVPTLFDAGALAIEIARLRVGLRRQLEEVRASRARIVAAGDEERRRVERDLHDGAQQRLVSIGLALRHAQHTLGPGVDPEVDLTLDGAVAEITVAIDELRELASGLRPAPLDDGLRPALQDMARRAPLPVDVVANRDRYAPEVELAAYFTASEGLTNAIKHARASRVVLRADRAASRLVVTVVDDGIGGAAPRHGSGLSGLADRVAARGGTLTIDSGEGRGTTLVAEFPCES